MNIGLLLVVIIGYALGAIPTAWIIRKLTTGDDITKEGSGNVGARNLADVSNNAWLGIAAGVIDAMKGVAAVLISTALHGDWFAAKACAGVAVVFGHNYNVFLRFKGGRGLATALGAVVLINPLMVFTWGLMYLMGYFVIRRDIHVASMTATIATVVLVFSFPERVIRLTTIVTLYEAIQLRLYVAAIGFLIFLRHVEPIREFLVREHDTE